jgi:transitional endoplasmic reticulum ATPase
MTRKQRIELDLVPLGDEKAFHSLLSGDESLTLQELLRRAPALATQPVSDDLLPRPLKDLHIRVLKSDPARAYYRPTPTSGDGQDPPSAAVSPPAAAAPPAAAPPPALAPSVRPASITLEHATRLAYSREIESVASFLRTGLSVLVACDKLVVPYLWPATVRQAHLQARPLEVPEEEGGGLLERSIRQRQLAELKSLIKSLKQGDVLVIPHLDLLAGGTDANLTTESRELIELVYGASDRLILAFTDRSLSIPEVLAARFAVRALVSGVPRTISSPGKRDDLLLGDALITDPEAAVFKNFDPKALYKNVAGMNAVRFRDAIAYAVKEHAAKAPVPVSQLYLAIRAFKAQTSLKFEVPDVKFDDIGGYEDVKAELRRAISLMVDQTGDLPEEIQRELIPRGFMFYGPPGTGKTLFAKAVANQLNATIQVVSGPEVTDMYVGESERKVRELFAEARRNAPAVLVFDEFDSIAAKRSGREDGGSRAGNAIVAQILTEMDGFRPDVPLLVIGTTNRLDIIDEALLRPSRFQAIGIGLPDQTARRAIADVHAKHFRIEVPAALLDAIAQATDGLNGDEIRSVFRDACVGQYCERPQIPADARRLGRLVGRIRMAHEQRSATVSSSGSGGPAAPARAGTRVAPSSSSMTRLTPEPAPPPPPPSGDSASAEAKETSS